MCVTCKGDTHDTDWGPWCDACGGVSFRPGVLFFRHVATVDGPGGRFPIIYDLSTSDYAFMHKERNWPTGKADMDGFKRPMVQVSHGSLDVVIALSHPDVHGSPDATGDDARQPELSAAPSATEEEKAIVLRGL